MSKKAFGFFGKQKAYEKEVLENGIQQKYSGFYADSFKRLKKNKMAMFCAVVLIIIILIAIFAPLLAPYDPTYQDYSAVLASPSMAHPFGTDEYGRDILSRIIYGSRVSISIGIVAQIVASLVGITLGALAGYYGGVVDSVISRIMEIFQAFPDLIFAMAIMTFMGKGVLNLFIALGLLTWVRTARMIRGSVMQLKEKEYIEASRANGASTFWIITKGLIPNCLSTIIVMVTLGIPNAIMYEASLSFLGIGIQPGIAIMITVIAFNIFGDGLRDALDPKLKS